jgi:putative transposase
MNPEYGPCVCVVPLNDIGVRFIGQSNHSNRFDNESLIRSDDVLGNCDCWRSCHSCHGTSSTLSSINTHVEKKRSRDPLMTHMAGHLEDAGHKGGGNTKPDGPSEVRLRARSGSAAGPYLRLPDRQSPACGRVDATPDEDFVGGVQDADLGVGGGLSRRFNHPVKVMQSRCLLSQFVDWRQLLTIVRPDTLVRWHRDLFRLFWRLKSRQRGRPRIPIEVQRLIAEMATDNRTWGEERIAAELRVKPGLTVSPRTVRRYMPSRPRPRGGRSAQSWVVFLHNHAGAVLACDFFIVVTATFQRLYVFVLLDIGTRRIVHWNLTDRPRSEWTIQQFRNGLPLDGTYHFLVHDRDGIFAPAVDEALWSMSLQVLKTPVRAPQANAHCERFIGTARRECLDWIIPLNERHLRSVLAEWVSHYNGGRPQSALGLGRPNDPSHQTILTRHRLRAHRVVAHTRLDGLHHHYQLKRIAA